MHQILYSIKVKAQRWRHTIQRRQFAAMYHAALPALSGYGDHRLALEARFAQHHQRYIAEVSAVNWAASLETCCVLYYLCQQMRPDIVIDIGSGFSSYVLRTYQDSEHPQTTVYSVDDNSDWLLTTRRYLSEHGFMDDNVISWDEFQTLEHPKADLLFFDFATPKVRIPVLQQLVKYMRPGSVLLLDDVHKSNMREASLQLIEQHNLKYHDLYKVTCDQIGRYAWVVHSFA